MLKSSKRLIKLDSRLAIEDVKAWLETAACRKLSRRPGSPVLRDNQSSSPKQMNGQHTWRLS